MSAGQGAGANRRFVFTGGPGAGKTTVLEALRTAGHRCVSETARDVIRDRLAAGLSPRPEPGAFARLIFAADVANYRAATEPETHFYDRSLIDALGMVHECEPRSDAQIGRIVGRYPYNGTVFLFPPWEEIYQTDAERDQTFAESVRVFESLRRWYGRCGYQPLEVPIGPVAERVEFVEQRVGEVLSRHA